VVVDIHAVYEEGTVPYLVMEFIAGITLDDRVKQSGPLEVKEVLRIGMQAARGLAAAHAQGLIHRDVKPGNILLENGVQRVKITDFGLARAVDDASLTQSGMVAGTPLYMSPEQARGEALDHRSDLFSLGSVLYSLCTGRPAFSAGNAMAVMKRVCEDTARPIREINPDIPDWLAAVVGKLLAKDPRDRFQSAAALAELLGQQLAQLQQPSLAPPPTVVQPRPGGPAPRTRRRWVAAVLGLVSIAASVGTLAILSWAWLVPPGDDRSEGLKPTVKKETTPSPEDPRVLTVSQKPDRGGRFRTIQEALAKVEPGMTIRVLDDAVYEEYLLVNRPEQHRRVMLETSGKATIRTSPSRFEAVRIKDVPDFTFRGFRLESGPKRRHGHVSIYGPCPGLVLDHLDMKANEAGDGIFLYDAPLAGKDAPIVIQNCTMRGGRMGVVIQGRDRTDRDLALPCNHVVVRNNVLAGCEQAVVLIGAVHRAQVVGNCIWDSKQGAIDLIDLLPGAADILVANNTLFQNKTALRVWDDHAKGKAFRQCKNIRIQNNLVLEPELSADLFFRDHTRGDMNQVRPPDLASLLESREWRFSHNWREIDPLKPDSRFSGAWIPRCHQDQLRIPINVLSRQPGAADFLRPPKDSPLAKAGVGVDDPAMPAYVGAVPPEGVAPWDWEKTWKLLGR
jgi:hypothetical protein